MDVSVIIPVYNGEKSISTSLDSLVRQTHRNFEVVVVNDGSVDGTEKVIKSYADELNLNYVYQDNAGVASARNKGMELAKGMYVTFLDADDHYEPSFIEKMHRKISSSNSDICYCGYNVVTINGSSHRRTCFTDERVLLKYILGKVAAQTTAWILCRDLIKEHQLEFPRGVSIMLP